MKTKTRINRLVEVFDNAESPLLNIFFTAGFPNLEDTGVIARALQDADVDMIEIGMPFSDPLADGPVISESSMTALENGMTLELLFEQLDTIDFEVPVVLMGYFNPVLQYGVLRFCERCALAGISGLIIPDLPLELYPALKGRRRAKASIPNVDRMGNRPHVQATVLEPQGRFGMRPRGQRCPGP